MKYFPKSVKKNDFFSGKVIPLMFSKPILYVGRVYPAVMWDYFNNGASIRMINPQYFSNSVWRLCATLQVRTEPVLSIDSGRIVHVLWGRYVGR